MELSSLKLKKLLYFMRELANPENQTFILFSDFLFVETKLFKHKCKRKKFLTLSLTHMQNFLN